MGLFFGALLTLFCIVTFFLPWINLLRIGPLQRQVQDLRRDLRAAEEKLSALEGVPVPPRQSEKGAAAHRSDPVILKDVSPPAPPPPLAPPPLSQPAPAPALPRSGPSAVEQPAPRDSFELNMGAKLPVWIGAISLICAAFFLVKYSMEAGWLGPVTRLILGALFGAGLIAAGRWAYARTDIANHSRIAQGLTGAGLVSLYVVLYAAVHLYQLLPPLAGFCAMAGVTGLAVLLSLRHGQPIAAFGLCGGLLTPALIGSPDPNTAALFLYLFALFSAMLFVLARRGWWVLAIVALLGTFLWSVLWFSVLFLAGEAFIVALFGVGLCLAVLIATGRSIKAETAPPGVRALNLTALAGATLTLLWLGNIITLTPFDWSLLALLTLALTGLAFYQPAQYRYALLAKLGADLLLFALWIDQGADTIPLSSALTLAALLAALYVLLPRIISRRGLEPKLWAGLQVLGALGLYLLLYNEYGAEPDSTLWTLAALALAALAIHQTALMRHRNDDVTALYALAATSFLSLGLAIALPLSWLPLALALEIAAALALAERTGIVFLRKIALILTLSFIALNVEQIGLFASLLISGLAGGSSLPSSLPGLVPDHPWLQPGLSALALAVALALHLRQSEPGKTLSHLLAGTVTALVLALAYYTVRALANGGAIPITTPSGFIERGAITLTIGTAAVALYHGSRHAPLCFLRIWSLGLLHLALARYLWLDLLVLNPQGDSTQRVGDTPLLNGIALTYGGGLALSVWAITHPLKTGDRRALTKFYKIAAGLLLLALTSLEVSQFFHGSVLYGTTPADTELYSYSFVWLTTGLVLLALGIVRQSRSLRVASLCFMLLTVGKVFLIDAGELEGLYRVFSFLGLGLSLIGLSAFYTRFIQRTGNS